MPVKAPVKPSAKSSERTKADLYLNGHKLGHTENMHRRFPFSIKEWAKEGENLLELHLASPLKFIEDYKPEKGREIHMCNTGTMPGNQYLRKPHCMFGWDWGPQLPDAGIFRKIELVTYEKARLLDTLIRQKHEEGQVTLTMTTRVSALRSSQQDHFRDKAAFHPDPEPRWSALLLHPHPFPLR